MSHKKRRKSIIDRFFDESLIDESNEIFERFKREKIGGGYSISVTQTPEGTKVHAKVSDDRDISELRRRLHQQYPDAHIEIEGGKPLIREISTKSVGEEKDKRDKEER